jgi:sirohydrochlorin cobaltochelatase
MPPETALAAVLSDKSRFGQLFIQRTNTSGFVLCHREDENADRLEILRKPDDALEIARYDDAGKYRPLKTAPNLRHGWRLELGDVGELRKALDHFYPGRVAMLAAWTENRLSTTSLRETLDRQSGMYRVAAKISDEEIDDVVGNFCKSDGGCLRTILWKRDRDGAIPSTQLPLAKFDPGHDQTDRGENAMPLLCQEACSLLVAECRKVVKGETDK